MAEPPQFSDEDIFARNITTDDVVPGDHLAVLDRNPYRDDYYHHGIYVGGPHVVHFSGDSKSNAKVSRIGLGEFLDSRLLFRINYPTNKRKRAEDTVALANEILNEQNWDTYHVLKNNCEHFATYCATGTRNSEQAIVFIKRCLKSVVENVGSPIQKPLLS